MKPKVFVTRPIGDEALALLAAHSDVQFHAEDHRIDGPKLAEAARDVDGLVMCGARLTADVLREVRRLRAVSNVGVGYDNIDVAACTARRIPVTNTAGALEEATADFAFALLLAAARRVAEADRYVRDGRWQSWEWKLLWGVELNGKTLGLLGFGRIGQAMARRAHGFGMRILYHTRRRVDASTEHELAARWVDFDTLLREPDFLSLHIPLTPETTRRIGERELAQMKPTVFLVNTARGKVVDEAALVRALRERRIAGAALDVFESEPQVQPELIAMPNVVLAPHVGSAATETRRRMAMLAAQNLVALLDGQRPANVVNPEVYS
jgi:lactate dehydrogenase-like 2-hydroxyacid dehydrogenase